MIWLGVQAGRIVDCILGQLDIHADRERLCDLLLRPCTNHCTSVTKLCGHIRHVLALQHLSDVAKVDSCGAVFCRIAHIVQSKFLVVGRGVDLGGVQETSMMDRAVVECLDDYLVFVCDVCVTDVDQPIGGAR